MSQEVDALPPMLAESSIGASSRLAADAGAHVDSQGWFALSPYQRDIWLVQQLDPRSPQFNMGGHFRIVGRIDMDRLLGALRRVLHHFEVLRFEIREVSGMPLQRVKSQTECEPKLVDLSAEADPQRACLEWLDRERLRPFRFDGDSLYEVVVIRESESVHYLYQRTHHIIMDGWGIIIVSQACFDAYNRPAAPLPAGGSYVELLRKRQAYVQSPAYQKDRRYWCEALGHVPESPFARTTAGRGPGKTVGERLFIDREQFARFEKRSHALQQTPFVLMTSVLAITLSRLYQVPEVWIGVTLLNRLSAEERDVVGQVVNILPLAITVSPEDTAEAVMAQVGRKAFSAMRHQRFPAGDLQKELANSGKLEHGRPLFDVTVSYHEFTFDPWQELHDNGTRHGMVEMEEHGYEQVAEQAEALSMAVRKFGESLDIVIDLLFRSDRFDEHFTCTDFAAAFKLVLDAILEREGAVVEALPIVPPRHRDQLASFNETRISHDHPESLPAAYYLQAERTPDATALIDAEGTSTSYRTSSSMVSRLALQLRRLGIDQRAPVAILMPRSLEMWLAIMAVESAGGAYLPVDPGYPPERIKLLLQDSNAKFLLSQKQQLEKLADYFVGSDVTAVDVDDLLRHGDSLVQMDTVPVSKADLAYVIYTSGSTGRPKGVQIEHGAIMNRLAFMQRRYPIGRGDVLLLKTPTTFDVSVWELFWWSQQGAALSILAPDAHLDPEKIIRQIRRDAVTVVHFVPSMLSAFLQHIESHPATVADLRSLRWVFCSGEALLPAHANRFNAAMASLSPAPQLVNLYGPTEAAVDVSYFDCPRTTTIDCVPIGKPVDNTQLLVLNEHGNPLPIGLPGELCIGGVQLARGYLSQPELTAAKFVYRCIDGSSEPCRLYRTGDRARWRADGELEYLGRFDDQIKLRGQRIELGEIQSHIVQYPGIRDAVVSVVTLAGNDTLCGYYVAERHIEADDIRRFLSSRLPEAMVPTWLQAIDALPLTANGKVNRKALPLPGNVESLRTYQAPRTLVEQQLAELWSRLLGVARVGMNDNYFSLGGNSILSLELRAEAHGVGIEITLADLVQHPTIAELAPIVSARQPSMKSAPELSYRPFSALAEADREELPETAQDAIPCTRLQLGMLYHSQAHPQSAMYHDVFQYCLDLKWSETEFREALTALVAKHPVLRSSFELGRTATPMQVFHRNVPLPLASVDCAGVSVEELQADAYQYFEEARELRYQWRQPPLWSMTVHGSTQALALTFAFHHSILDGYSVASLVSELLASYARRLSGGLLEQAPMNAALLAEAERMQRSAVAEAETTDFWKAYLDGAAPSQLPGWTANESSNESWSAGELLSRHIELPRAVGSRLESLSRLHNVPVKHLGLAVHCAMLHLLGDSTEVTTGLVTHVRPEAHNAEQIAGLLLNTLPIRVGKLSGNWLELARRCNAEEARIYPHRYYPLADMHAAFGMSPLETAYNYVSFHHIERILEGRPVQLLGLRIWEQTSFSFLVNLIRQPHNGLFRLRLDFDGQRYSPRQADLIAQYYRAAFMRLVEHPEEAVSADCLRACRDSYRPQSSVMSLFQLQSEVSARRPAIIFNGGIWTYRVAARMADCLASKLQARGIQRGDVVALLIDRGPFQVASVLGVMQAGGVCAPFDPSYPRERLQLMAQLAAPKFVVGQESYRGIADDALAYLGVESVFSAPSGNDQSTVAAIDDNDPAYMLFTSGSTGVPKAVVMPHGALANLIQWQASVPSGQGLPTTLQFAPSSFDVSFQEIFSTLCWGGKLVIASDEARADARKLLDLLIESDVERVFLPYVALQQLAESAVSLRRYPRKLARIISSGEQLRVTPEIRELAKALPGCLLENQYGPTETHVASFHTMMGPPATWPKLPPIGMPIAGAQILLLDESLAEVPIGAAGEIFIGGRCLAHGYAGNAELTSSKFVAHPFVEGRKLYRTGDLGRRLPDDTLVYLGRKDRQVKIRGFRVEPGEVEAAILKTGLVTDAAVINRPDASGQNALFGYLVGKEAVDIEKVRQMLRASLPGYLIPAQLEQLDRLPKTPSGKRDDDALRRRSLPQQHGPASRAPATETEHQLLAIVRRVLNKAAFEVEHDIFHAGGNSLHAVQIAVSIESQLNVQLPLAQLIATPTVAALARCVDEAGLLSRYRSLVPLQAAGNRAPIYLVHPIGGNVLCYMPMLPHISSDQPVYALQAPGVFGDTHPCRSIPELAAHYIQEMKRQQPAGPYVIGGWSFGGMVAFEMARQLKAAGERLTALFMLDTIAIDPSKGTRVTEDQLLTWFLWDLCYGAKGEEEGLREPQLAGLSTHEKFEHLLAQAIDQGALPAGSPLAIIRRHFDVFLAHWQAMLEYHPRPIPQDILLLRATLPLPRTLKLPHAAVGSQYQDGSNGWSAYTLGKVHVVSVPGDHLGLMREPAISTVVATLLAKLREIER